MEDNNPQQFDYMMLSRLKQDCEYFLGFGNGADKHLWAGNVEEQISEMKRLYDLLEIKPDWISMSDIEDYENKMKGIKDV